MPSELPPYEGSPFNRPPEQSSTATHKKGVLSAVHIIIISLIAVCVLMSIIAVARVLVLGGTFGKKYMPEYKADIENGLAKSKEQEGEQYTYTTSSMAPSYYAGTAPPPPYQERQDEEENHGFCRRMCECCCVFIALNPISRCLGAIYGHMHKCLGGVGTCLFCFLLCR